MANADIFGYSEEIWGERRDAKVFVWKRHFRSAWDAAVPPGQSVGFEFYVAEFPINLVFTHSGDEVGTTARLLGAGESGERAGGGAGSGARDRGIIAGRSATTATVTARTSDIRLSDRAAEEAMRQPTVIALRRPTQPWGTGGLDDIVIDPEPPPPLPDREIPFEITLTPPNGLAPLVYTRPMRSHIDQWPNDTMARIDPAYLERGKGLWHISVKNINDTGYRMQVVVQVVHAVTAVSRQDIPLSLLNNLSSVALKRAMPTIEYADDRLIVSTPDPFLDLMGIDRERSLGSAAEAAIKDLPTFTAITVRILSREAFIARLHERKAEIQRAFNEALAELGAGSLQNILIGWRQPAEVACDEAIEQIESLPAFRTAYCLVVEGMFTDRDVELHYVGTIAEIDNQIPQIGLIFDEGLNFTDVVSTLAISLSPALTKIVAGTLGTAAAMSVIGGPILGVAVLIGGAFLYNSVDEIDIEEEMRQQIRDRGKTIAGYVRRAIERITDLGAMALDGQILRGAAADGSDLLRIHYFNPSIVRPPRPWRPIDDLLGSLQEFTEVLQIGTGELEGRPGGALITEAATAQGGAERRRTTATTARAARLPAEAVVERVVELTREQAGPLPEDWEVPDPETLDRLDAHDCIAIVMMENRSYDHFFHELAVAYPGRGYRPVPNDFTNDAPPGFGEPFRPVRNTTIGIGKNLIFLGNKRSSDPNHNYDHTRLQIGRGTEDTAGSGEMAGFAIDFAGKSDSPQIVMSYFGMEDLPVYHALAGHYPVCDRWFASLPVGTYPNRLASHQGNVPFLYNIHMDDPSLGYLEDYSIFDVLDSQGIQWRMYESDIGTIRLYDRYRLNVSNVRPIGELEVMLEAVMNGAAQLPRVIFIEPQFLFGDDDHPPMGVHKGQDFLRQVIGKFLQYGQLDRTLFAITYDEHGGFFDHVSPPGTRPRRRPPGTEAAGPYGEFHGLFPQGPEEEPTSLGVRVPAVVLSKWASAQANDTILDHTAILKTILLHNRASISTEQYGRFGERVKKKGHLGQVLDLPSPRAIDYAALEAAIGYVRGPWHSTSHASVVSSRMAGINSQHPANVLRGIAIPRPRLVKS